MGHHAAHKICMQATQHTPVNSYYQGAKQLTYDGTTQVWYNVERGRKPQSFTEQSNLADPTDGGRTCDFCQWRTLTALDVFGR